MKKGRIQGWRFLYATIDFFGHIACRSSVAFAALVQLPALLSSCVAANPEFTHEIRVTTKALAGEPIDLFFFDAAAPYMLDSYQRISTGSSPVYGMSGPGRKMVIAISARGEDIYERSYVKALGDLSSDIFSLKHEHPVKPLLFGSAYLEEGRSRAVNLYLKPALCRIRVRSLCCNFRERPYAGEVLENVKLFLINAVSEFAPADEAEGRPVSWENFGCPGYENPMLCSENIGTVGPERIYPDVTLYCYPNPAKREVPGVPFTRLVLEGDVGGVHCYYPVNLPEMSMGKDYEFDITVLRMGTSNPDLPAQPGQMIIDYSTVPWDEKDHHTEVF